MATINNHLVAAGPIDPAHKFPQWFEDGKGLKLELVTQPDPNAPALGDIPQPGFPVVFPGNFPDEAFYFMAEARLEVGGNGLVGRARVIMALETAFSGDERPVDGLGVVFARLRVRIDDVIPGAEYTVYHPYGDVKNLADERGRVAYTCDLGLAEGNMQRVLITGQIAPFLEWTSGAKTGYIGDGVTEHTVKNGPFRNHVEIVGPRIDEGSGDAAGPGVVRTDLFTVQGRKAGTGANASPGPLGGPGVSVLQLLSAEYRTSRAQYRIRGTILPVSVAKPGGGYQSDRVDVWVDGSLLGSAFPDVTGAWDFRKTLPGPTPPAPGQLLTVTVKTTSNQTASQLLRVRN